MASSASNSAASQSSSGSMRQYLSSLLSSSGPSALPYDDGVKFVIREQISHTIHEYPGLQVRPAAFTHNNGVSVTLLQLEGTIPMWYRNVKYNIPITIWLLEHFPHVAPLVYVTPTKDMVIRQHHKHVNSSGLVDIPYLHDWKYQQASLLDLVQMLSLMFGHEPPLYAKPSPPSTATATAAASGAAAAAQAWHPGAGQASQPPGLAKVSDFQASNPMHSTAAGGGRVASGGAVAAANQGGAGVPAVAAASAAAAAKVVEDPAAVFKRAAVTALSEKLKRDMGMMREGQCARMDALLSQQQQLMQRKEAIRFGVRELRQEKEALEQTLQVYLTNTDVLQSWLAANDSTPAAVDVDTVFTPIDAWSKQLLDCLAADLALEDMLYALDKAVQEDDMSGRSRAISAEQYFQKTRALAREQFFQRAIAAKVRGAQAQAQVQQMAARGSYSAYG